VKRLPIAAMMLVMLSGCSGCKTPENEQPKQERRQKQERAESILPFKPRPKAKIGGNIAPDGKTEIQCDFPADKMRQNTTSQGQGCCVWTSIHHAAVWQNCPAYQEAPAWIQAHAIPGAAGPADVQKYLPLIANDHGFAAPAIMNYRGSDLEILKLACKTGRVASALYTRSPTGRYDGEPISHFVNPLHADDKWVAVLDNNFIGPDQIEWMSPEEFKKIWTSDGKTNGWLVILLTPPPPPPPHN
jgi:hypothetical protein